MLTRLTTASFVLLLVLSGAACRIADVEERVEQSDIALTTEMDVKTALLNAQDVWGAPIRVIYAEGAIRLSGFVANSRERRRAVEAAQQAVPDVRIIDDIEVWTAARAATRDN